MHRKAAPGYASSLAVAVTVPLVAACAPLDPSRGILHPPAPVDFTGSSMTFWVAGTQRSVQDDLIDSLRQKGMPAREDSSGTKALVITDYRAEPALPGAPRTQAVAYLFAVGTPRSAKPCVPLDVSWVTKSQGRHEYAWSTQQEDSTSTPTSWPLVQAGLVAHGCRP